MRRSIIVLAVFVTVCGMVLSLFILPETTSSVGYAIPSLFHNDEAWYRDSVSPLILRDERYYIPIEMLSMFGKLQVSYYDGEENILVAHENGTYVSLLYEDRSAAVNGKLTAGIGLFRDKGYTYVEAAWIADIFGLTCTWHTEEDGHTLLRITDGEAERTLEELLRLYREGYGVQETEQKKPDIPTAVIPGSSTIKPEPTEDAGKRIYIVSGDNRENPTFVPAEDIVENSGLVCTLFLHSRSDTEKFWEYAFTGRGGLCVESLAEAEEINRRLEAMFCRRVEFVLPAAEDTDREELTRAGYVVIEPDFVVDYSTDPDLVYGELCTWLETHEEVVVQVSGDGCSQRMIALLCNLTADGTYRTEKLLSEMGIK